MSLRFSSEHRTVGEEFTHFTNSMWQRIFPKSMFNEHYEPKLKLGMSFWYYFMQKQHFVRGIRSHVLGPLFAGKNTWVKNVSNLELNRILRALGPQLVINPSLSSRFPSIFTFDSKKKHLVLKPFFRKFFVPFRTRRGLEYDLSYRFKYPRKRSLKASKLNSLKNRIMIKNSFKRLGFNHRRKVEGHGAYYHKDLFFQDIRLGSLNPSNEKFNYSELSDFVFNRALEELFFHYPKFKRFETYGSDWTNDGFDESNYTFHFDDKRRQILNRYFLMDGMFRNSFPTSDFIIRKIYFHDSNKIIPISEIQSDSANLSLKLVNLKQDQLDLSKFWLISRYHPRNFPFLGKDWRSSHYSLDHTRFILLISYLKHKFFFGNSDNTYLNWVKSDILFRHLNGVNSSLLIKLFDTQSTLNSSENFLLKKESLGFNLGFSPTSFSNYWTSFKFNFFLNLILGSSNSKLSVESEKLLSKLLVSKNYFSSNFEIFLGTLTHLQRFLKFNRRESLSDFPSLINTIFHNLDGKSQTPYLNALSYGRSSITFWLNIRTYVCLYLMIKSESWQIYSKVKSHKQYLV